MVMMSPLAFAHPVILKPQLLWKKLRVNTVNCTALNAIEVDMEPSLSVKIATDNRMLMHSMQSFLSVENAMGWLIAWIELSLP